MLSKPKKDNELCRRKNHVCRNFTATIRTLDDEYTKTAEKLRALAFKKYDCIHFTSCTEGSNKIALSFWHSEADILAWHANTQHKAAQIRGKRR